MTNDETTTYLVESMNLRALPKRIGTSSIDILKLDLEGAEYDLLDGIAKEDLLSFDQIFVEFHHHCTNHSFQETNRLAQNVSNLGFRQFSLDNHDYLFYR